MRGCKTLEMGEAKERDTENGWEWAGRIEQEIRSDVFSTYLSGASLW
jgi:hypothetical protein